MNKLINDVHIKNIRKLISPEKLKNLLPNTNMNISFVENSRQTINKILAGVDKRKLVIVGPCSIHNIEMAKEY